MDLRIESNGQFSDLRSGGASARNLGTPFVQSPPDRGHYQRSSDPRAVLKHLDSAALDCASVGAQIGNDPVTSLQARNEMVRLSLTGFMVISAGSLWGWAIVDLIQFLCHVEQLGLQVTEQFHP